MEQFKQPRQRNRRGEGDRLRTEIIAAAIRLLERQGDGEAFTLRAVAKEAKISPPSVYLQFNDLGELLLALLALLFAQQEARLDASEQLAAGGDARALLLARAKAYVLFGLEHPNTYRVMYEGRAISRLDDPTRANLAQASSSRSTELFRELRPDVADPFRLAFLLWTGLHGLVSARINKPVFTWPPIEELVEQVLDAYLHGPA